MFKKLRNETKKALTKVGAFIEASLEATGEILDDISDIDFD
jgi:hypothetical protein